MKFLHYSIISISIITLFTISLLAESWKEPANGTTIQIIAGANWKGHFGEDESGAGGVGALYTRVQNLRSLLNNQGGVLLFHAGDMTGKNTENDIVSLLAPRSVNLVRKLGIDALAPSKNERDIFEKTKNIDLKHFPVVYNSINKNNILPFRIIPVRTYNIFVSSLDLSSNDTIKKQNSILKSELEKQTGVDLIVILISDTAENMPDEDLFEILDNNPPSKTIIFPEKLPQSTKILYISPGEVAGRFVRLKSGAYLCQVNQGNICDIKFQMRNHKILNVAGQTYKLNHPDYPYRYVPPERHLLKIYR